MTVVLLLSATVYATSWPDVFVSQTRSDAPTDGVLLFADPGGMIATATDESGFETHLDIRYVSGWPDDDATISKVTPPVGGWSAGETYTVTLRSHFPYSASTDLPQSTFTTSSGASPPPHAPSVSGIRVGPWMDQATFTLHASYSEVRSIEFDVDAGDADPWAWTGIIALGTDGLPVYLNVPFSDITVGPGTASLTSVQWFDTELHAIVPPCFHVVGVSAAGVSAVAETWCADGALPPSVVDDTADTGELLGATTPVTRSEQGGCAGCSSSDTGHWTAVPLAILMYLRRRRVPGSMRRITPLDVVPSPSAPSSSSSREQAAGANAVPTRELAPCN